MLSAQNISKHYSCNGTRVSVLQQIDFRLAEGEFVAIIGRSGSGKTTLLNILSTLIRPDSGQIHYHDKELTSLAEKERNRLRKTDFAVIFQFHHLLPYLTVLENTLLPLMGGLSPISRAERERARQCLQRVGLTGLADRLPGRLSGGEQQRVAIARALVTDSRILFADEPTGSLDTATGSRIMALLAELHQEGLSIVMVTHEPAYAALAQRTVELEDGVRLN
ncbi:ABC transporter ATP-binding protein [Desulfogranum mediterraneum]|uniref:ABC transporter ATP-binding protein n=1 Tax=Desulfogranum mediterraneum TaxID=160661 RepID=UPI000428894F|nr:ABC transporter ATP-binding protein [Desulfogranum mediterraneum]